MQRASAPRRIRRTTTTVQAQARRSLVEELSSRLCQVLFRWWQPTWRRQLRRLRCQRRVAVLWAAIEEGEADSKQVSSVFEVH